MAAFLALTALACASGASVTYATADALRDRGVVTLGIVVGVHESVGRADTSYVTVRFRDSKGVHHEAEISSYLWSPEPQIGDMPKVVYDPQDPGTAADVRLGPDFLLPTMLTVAALVAGVLVWPTATGRIDWARLRS